MKRLLLILTALVLVAAGAVWAGNGATFDPNQPYSYTPNPSAVTNVSTTYTALSTDHLINANSTSAGFTITLPALSTLNAGKGYVFRNTGTASKVVTIASATGDTIAGQTSRKMSTAQNSLLTIVRGPGRNWLVEWETPPVQSNMSTLVTRVSGTVSADILASTVTVTTSAAACWKADGKTLGYCSTTPTNGACTCN